MILQKTGFKAKLIACPETVDEKTKEKKKLGIFTIGKKYRVYSIFDNGKFTDFLIADDEGVYYWIKMEVFRSK